MAGREAFSELSNGDKQAAVEQLLIDNAALRGENYRVLANALAILDRLSDAATLAEVAGLLARMPAAAGAAAGTLAAVSAFLFPVGGLISVINAYEAGQRQYGFRAIAYATTAWAFGQPVPKGSRKLMENAQRGIPGLNREAVEAYERAWREASSAAVTRLNLLPVQYRTSAASLRLLLRATADDQPRQLCQQLLARFERELPSLQQHIWRSKYTVQFPD